MARTPIDIPPGLFSDDTDAAAASRWVAGSNVRFRLKRPQPIGGWESLMATLLTGVCRWIFPWSTNDGQTHFAFGTHTSLQVWSGGALYDATPTLARPKRLLNADPLAVTNGSDLVTVSDPGHQLTTGDEVVVTGAAAVGGITPNGTFTVTVVNGDVYTYHFGSAASGTASGGGSAIFVQPTAAFQPGQIDGTGQAGYGTGPYGAGGYATPSVDDYFPRTWSGGSYGQDLIASPRLGAIYRWDPTATGTPAAPLPNSPNRVTFALVNDQRQVMAFGCNEEVSGVYNPLAIRFSDLENPEDWETHPANNAGEVILAGGGRLVGARRVGQYVLAWTETALHLGTFIGDPTQTWRFDEVGDKCGLIGPGAAVVYGQTAYWVTPAGQFFSYALGGAPALIPCPIRDDFFDNLAAAQAVKIVASTIGAFGEVRWDYPDSRDGAENSRYVAVAVSGPDAGCWYRGQMARTAMVDAGPASHPLGVTFAGRVYWHERGQSADGAPLAWFIESGDLVLSNDRQSMMVRDLEPDFKDQVGPVNVTLFARDYPQSAEETWGPFVFAPGDDFMDFRAEARIVRVRYAGSSSPAFARLGRPTFDLVGLGRR